MKYLLITGNHPRHLYYTNKIIENCEVSGVICQHRDGFMPEPEPDLNKIDKENFIKHFKNREFYEKEYFGLNTTINHKNIHYVDYKTLSGDSTIDFIKKVDADVCFIFGCGMIREPLFSLLPELKINLHLGLSPRYRGSATLFWPFYFLEPNWAGSTFHIISEEADAGDIVHQSVPILERGDTIHQVSCKVVQQSANDISLIIKQLELFGNVNLTKQTTTGKNFMSQDFMASHLRAIYNLYEDKLVDYFLDNKITKRERKLIQINGGQK